MIIRLSVAILGNKSNGGVYIATLEKISDITPSVGMEIENPAFSTIKKVQLVSWNTVENHLVVHLDDEQTEDPTALERTKQAFMEEGWEVP